MREYKWAFCVYNCRYYWLFLLASVNVLSSRVEKRDGETPFIKKRKEVVFEYGCVCVN